MIHAGISGEVTAEGLARLPRGLEDTAPDLLPRLEGGHDILRHLDPAITHANLAAMLELAQARGIPVARIGVPEKRLFSKVAPLYRALAET
ncbi:hypothetical protein [Thiocystis violacea]|uniref:hypothetical protein n=1 Tax=Thiocystis violacea TaxID=13725 RepID=UPI001904468D|nr:hypothetical protein [Thiocystis violacea]MBK1717634.1 hypothetical protein [Thiocystis violacea]